jgi:1,4-dihydroxy-2-naphthoyl-CoA hydrolase
MSTSEPSNIARDDSRVIADPALEERAGHILRMAPIALEDSYPGLYGLRVTAATDDRIEAKVAVRDAIKQGFGIVNGGVYASMAEDMASLATQAVVFADQKFAVGSSNYTSFLRPITEGTIHGEGAAVHRGRTTWLWEIRFSDDAGRLCALSRVTIALRGAE